jgi:hypothetical protein
MPVLIQHERFCKSSSPFSVENENVYGANGASYSHALPFAAEPNHAVHFVDHYKLLGGVRAHRSGVDGWMKLDNAIHCSSDNSSASRRYRDSDLTSPRLANPQPAP